MNINKICAMGGGKIAIPRIGVPKVGLPSVSPIGHVADDGYIKDGLVFWLDGINKGGEDGKWVDLVGGVEFTPSTSVIWGEDYVGGVLSASEPVGFPVRQSTIEYAATNITNWAAGQNLLVFNSGTADGICIGPTQSMLILTHSSANSIIYYDKSFGLAGGHCASGNCERMLHNLIANDTPLTGNQWNLRGPVAYVNYGNLASARIHSIRIYNRRLTEEEMRHNQEVDRKRFNLFTPYGIGIMLKSGEIEDYNNPRMKPAYTRDEIEGITFQLSGMSVVIHPDEPPKAYFCNGRTVCPEATAVATAAIASQQFNGQENTTILRNRLTADKTWAVNRAAGITIRGHQGYLPSLGEIMAIWPHKAVIDELLVKCGCALLPNESYWSSSLATRITADGEEVQSDPDAYLSYMYGIYGNGNWDGFNVQGLYRVLTIAAI